MRTQVLLYLLPLLGLLTACGQRDTTRPPDLLLRVAGGKILAPDTIAPGWTRVGVEEDGEGHIVVAFRLGGRGDDSSVALLASALDTAKATPATLHAMGGPEIGDSGEVVIELAAGRYLFGCVSRGPDGHRHISLGEGAVVVVRDAPIAAERQRPPAAAIELTLTDFAYVGTGTWPSGPQMIRIANTGHEDHQLRLVRLREGATIGAWMAAEDPEALADPVVGMARLGPGGVAYLPADLGPGHYVAYCLITDPASGRQHVEMGMLREFIVD